VNLRVQVIQLLHHEATRVLHALVVHGRPEGIQEEVQDSLRAERADLLVELGQEEALELTNQLISAKPYVPDQRMRSR
jgi:hypothetical protein